MNLAILHPTVQQFINDHLANDLTKLLFKGSPFNRVTVQELATQISGKKKAEKKLPSWYGAPDCYFPPTVNLEQSSSEITAAYKSALVSGNLLIDITGGFGVDAYAFSKRIDRVVHCDLNKELSTIVEHNYKQLSANNITCFYGDGLDYLKKTQEKIDWIFIDPSRRDDSNHKVFLLADCLPNVPENIPFLFSKTTNLLIKSSPILDISSAINELKFVAEIHVIAVQNEVKELLFVLVKDCKNDIFIKTINFQKDKLQEFNFSYKNPAESSYSAPKGFLYEPNAAILKSGGFHCISQQFGLEKLHPHSHLYTNNQLISFPGRVFKVDCIIPYDKKELKKIVPKNKANITTRNFPETVAQIRKKTGIKDGGNCYLFFTTDYQDKHIVISCTQLFDS